MHSSCKLKINEIRFSVEYFKLIKNIKKVKTNQFQKNKTFLEVYLVSLKLFSRTIIMRFFVPIKRQSLKISTVSMTLTLISHQTIKSLCVMIKELSFNYCDTVF